MIILFNKKFYEVKYERVESPCWYCDLKQYCDDMLKGRRDKDLHYRDTIYPCDELQEDAFLKEREKEDVL